MAPRTGEKEKPMKRPVSLISLYKVGHGEGLDEDQNDNVKGSLLSVDVIEAKDGEIPGVGTPEMTFKVKVIHSVLIFSAFLGFGFCRGIYGPTLLELRRITQVTLAQISMLFTCLGVGGIAGSLTFGRLFDRFNPLVLFVGALSSLASITAIIPWLNKLLVMMAACAAHSFVYSGLAIGCNVTLFRIWRDKSRPIFLSMHLLYTVGGFIAPLLSEPFLTPRDILTDIHCNDTQNTTNTSTTNITNYSQITDKNNIFSKIGEEKAFKSHTNNTTNGGNIATKPNQSLEHQIRHDHLGNNDYTADQVNIHNITVDQLDKTHLDFSNLSSIDTSSTLGYNDDSASDSRIFITYLILSLYLLTVAIAIFTLMIYMRDKKTGVYWKDYRPSGGLPCRGGASLYRLLATILFMLFNTHIGGQETLYSGLLFTFAVEHVGFTQTQGSLLVSMLFTAYTVGRFFSIFIGHWVPNASYVLMFNLAGASIASFTLAYFTTSNIIILWICTVIEGLSLSTMYTMGLLWAKDFIPITAAFTSLYTIAYTCGMMIWPPLTSSLMKRMGPEWFAYMNVILVICYAAAMALLSILYRLRFRFKDLSPTQDEDIEVKFQTKIDIIAHSVHSVNTV